MPQGMKRHHIGTIGHQIRLGHTLTLNCENCQHRADTDLTALVEENGSSYPLQSIVDPGGMQGMWWAGRERDARLRATASQVGGPPTTCAWPAAAGRL
jgi:hypothetical protein